MPLLQGAVLLQIVNGVIVASLGGLSGSSIVGEPQALLQVDGPVASPVASGQASVENNVSELRSGRNGSSDLALVSQERKPRRDKRIAGGQGGRIVQGFHAFNGFNSRLDSPSGTRHPFWKFEWIRFEQSEAWVCCVVLLFAGVLCSAGGIGGGGVYVTVLMVAGRIEIGDAVPLSKAVVFIGSISSLILNVRKSFSTADHQATLMDYNICRLVIPSSLGGTYIGVLLNSLLPGWFVALLLTLVLIVITTMVARTTWHQYKEETAGIDSAPRSSAARSKSFSEIKGQQTAGADADAARDDKSGSGPFLPRSASFEELSSRADVCKGATERTHRGRSKSAYQHARWTWHAGPKFRAASAAKKNTAMRGKVTAYDAFMAFLVLFVVVVFSVFRFHAGACQHASPDQVFERCNHPVFWWLGKNTMQTWMHHGPTADFLAVIAFIVPLLTCVLTCSFYALRMVWQQGWRAKEPIAYQLMAVSTGILAGLVGIGGGLVYSPFFLFMELEPAVAVATSSTCVLFTAASTSLQYLLTDRVIMSLAILYGIINLLASYLGTKLVHSLQDHFSARRSYISGIVGVGVFLSTVLALIELAHKLKSDSAASAH